MKTILLAAGEGNRMSLTEKYGSKVLLPVPHPFISGAQTSILHRLIIQVAAASSPHDIVLVVGHERDLIVYEVMDNWGLEGWPVRVVYNTKYATDTNVLSAYLGVSACCWDEYVIIESDILIDNLAMSVIYNEQVEKSVLYSCGPFTPGLYGGISKSVDGKIVDAQIVKEYEDKYRDYRKLLGITKISFRDYHSSTEFMREDIENGVDQYYWLSWFNRLDEFSLLEGDLSSFKASSFNTADDYYKALDIFREDLDGTDIGK